MEEPVEKIMMRNKNKFAKYVDGEEFMFIPVEKHESKIDLCDSTHLLERNTKSFLCLAQLLMSKSSLTADKHFLFSPLEDPGISLAFKYIEPRTEVDDIGGKIYKAICNEKHIFPISRILETLETDTLNLRYYGLSENQVKALSETLKINHHVQNLVLDDNILTTKMVAMISDAIAENTCLQTLSLRLCQIQAEGAEELGKILSGLATLYLLDLGFNDLGDKGLAFLEYGLTNNISIKILNLSHNNLTENSTEILERIFSVNSTIEELNLSWNGFFTAQGCKKLCSGFSTTDKIKKLNLSWNGLGIPQATIFLTKYIKQSVSLEELDLSNNRIVSDSIKLIRPALIANKSVRFLKIGNNIYTPADAHTLLTAISIKSNDPWQYLDMENVYIKKTSKPIYNKVIDMGKQVKIGGILSDYEITGPNIRKLIYDRCRYLLNKPKKVKARKDFGHFILMLPPNPITQEDFQKQLKKLKMKKLDKDLVQGLMNLFLINQNEVDCPELVKDYMSYFPDTVLPPPIPKKDKKRKKKQKMKGIQTEEVEIKVHDLENAENADVPAQQLDESENITIINEILPENVPVIEETN